MQQPQRLTQFVLCITSILKQGASDGSGVIRGGGGGGNMTADKNIQKKKKKKNETDRAGV